MLRRFSVLFIILFGALALRTVSAAPLTRWAFQTEGPIRGAAVVHDGGVYFGSADGFIYAVDQTSGELRWKVQTGGPIAGAPAVTKGLVIVSGRGDQVMALDLADGKPRWSFALQPALSPPTEWNYFTAPPVIDGDQVLIGAGDGHLYALEITTGRERWRFKTGDGIRVAALVADGTVYQPSGDDWVYALSARDGTLLWKFATDGVNLDLSQGFIRSDIFSRPSIQHGRLMFGSRDGKVYAVDIATHEKAWDFTYGGTWAMSAVADDTTLYVGWSTNNMINALDIATGEKRWEFKADAHTYSTGLILGKRIYWTCADGQLYGFDPATGARDWSYNIGSESYSSLVHDDGTFYFGADDGRLRAVTLDAPPAHRAVYLPASIPQSLQGYVNDAALAPYLVEHGYTLLDSADALAAWLAARTADGDPSAVVFGYAFIPAATMGPEPESGPLRAYLESGGKVVWLWGMPNRFRFDEQGNFLAADPTSAGRLLGVDFLGFEDSGNYYAKPTQTGRNWGLGVWLKTSFASLTPGADVIPLAWDEYGRVGAFLKRFHSRSTAGWVTFNPNSYGVPITPDELHMIERVASYGLE